MSHEQHRDINLAFSLSAERPSGVPFDMALDVTPALDGTYSLDLAQVVAAARQVREVAGGPTGKVRLVVAPWQPEETPAYSFADDRIVVDTAQRTVFGDGKPLPVTVQGFDLIQLLARHKNMTMPNGTLLERLWNCADDDVARNRLHMAVSSLRRSLGPELRSGVRTVKGVGYVALDSLEK